MLHKLLLLLPLILTATFAAASDPVEPAFTDIYEAAKRGTVTDVRFFLDQGVDVNADESLRFTPTDLAAWYNPDIDVLKYLLANGGNPRAENAINATRLHLAAEKNPNPEVLKYLIANGEDVNAKAIDGRTALHCAASHNPNIEVVKTLLEHGEEVNAQDNQGETPLFHADTQEKRAVLREAGGLMMFQNIFAAAKRGTADDIRFFIDQGADVNERNKNVDSTPLHTAAEYNPDIDVLKYLLEQGADVNATNMFAIIPLHWAAMSNPNADAVRVLIEHGANVNAEVRGRTPLDWADTKEKQQILRDTGGKSAWR